MSQTDDTNDDYSSYYETSEQLEEAIRECYQKFQDKYKQTFNSDEKYQLLEKQFDTEDVIQMPQEQMKLLEQYQFFAKEMNLENYKIDDQKSQILTMRIVGLYQTQESEIKQELTQAINQKSNSKQIVEKIEQIYNTYKDNQYIRDIILDYLVEIIQIENLYTSLYVETVQQLLKKDIFSKQKFSETIEKVFDDSITNQNLTQLDDYKISTLAKFISQFSQYDEYFKDMQVKCINIASEYNNLKVAFILTETVDITEDEVQRNFISKLQQLESENKLDALDQYKYTLLLERMNQCQFGDEIENTDIITIEEEKETETIIQKTQMKELRQFFDSSLNILEYLEQKYGQVTSQLFFDEEIQKLIKVITQTYILQRYSQKAIKQLQSVFNEAQIQQNMWQQFYYDIIGMFLELAQSKNKQFNNYIIDRISLFIGWLLTYQYIKIEELFNSVNQNYITLDLFIQIIFWVMLINIQISVDNLNDLASEDEQEMVVKILKQQGLEGIPKINDNEELDQFNSDTVDFWDEKDVDKKQLLNQIQQDVCFSIQKIIKGFDLNILFEHLNISQKQFLTIIIEKLKSPWLINCFLEDNDMINEYSDIKYQSLQNRVKQIHNCKVNFKVPARMLIKCMQDRDQQVNDIEKFIQGMDDQYIDKKYCKQILEKLK